MHKQKPSNKILIGNYLTCRGEQRSEAEHVVTYDPDVFFWSQQITGGQKHCSGGENLIFNYQQGLFAKNVPKQRIFPDIV